MWFRHTFNFVILGLSLELTSCAELNYIHDPQTGLISKDNVSSFLKSVRCELKTFYTVNDEQAVAFQAAMKSYDERLALANKAKKAAKPAEAEKYADEARVIHAQAVENHPHFLLSPSLFGGVYTDLKVIDTYGLPQAGGSSASTFDNKAVFNATHSSTWLLGPTLNNQNTYEQVDSYLIEQKPGLSASSSEPFDCYNSIPNNDYRDLAAGKMPEHELFTRVRVNGIEPLAAWLEDRSLQLWTTFHARDAAAEQDQLIPVQSLYNFTVQITAGLDVKYSLVGPVWNPAQIDFGASSAQSSLLTITLNGVDASLGAGAKVGTALDTSNDQEAQGGRPPYTAPGGLREVKKTTNKGILRNLFPPTRKYPSPPAVPAVPSAPPLSRGRLLYPIPIPPN